MSFLSSASPKLPPWKVLLVDDEPDIHDITKLTLSRFRLEGRALSFVHAYSGAEAKQVLARESGIALVFLDVVMEREDSGLEVARWMREDLGNQFTRIVLRTGQPGQAPEERVIVNYDINDYKEKTELDRTKLFTTTFAALRAYRDIMKVEEARLAQLHYREGLERVIAASAHIFKQRNLRDFASGLLQQVVALLRLETSMLLRLRGASAISGEQDYEILAQIGDTDDGILSPSLLSQLDDAKSNKISRLHGDTYVGYFPNSSGKASLLVLKGVEEISDLDAQLLEVFCSGVAIAFDNILLTQEITDTQAELILRLGDVRRHVGGHADRNTGGAVEQDIRQTRRQHQGFVEGAVKVRPPVGSALAQLAEQHFGITRQPRLGVTHGGEGFGVIRCTPVTLPVHQGIAVAERLGHQHHGFVARRVAVGVELAEYVTDGTRRLLVLGVCVQAQLAHGVDNTPLYRLEAVADMRQGPVHDDVHGVVEVGLFGEVGQ